MVTLRRSILIAAAAFAVAASVAPPARAQQITYESMKPGVPVAGAATFKAYCTPCHGISGRGDGPAAIALKVPPADLTSISKRNDGKFPENAVRETITGVDVLASHGSREMPIWGPAFRSVDNDSGVALLRVRNLILYLERLQVPGEGGRR